MKEVSCQVTTNHMLDYLIALLDDSNDFSWQAAKASHAVLLCRMEQDEVISWSETDKIDQITRANVQRHVVPTELVKEVSGKTQRAHLTMERKDRFVKKPVVAGSPYDSVPCVNKYAPLADIEDEYCDDSMEIVNQYMVDDGCSFAGLGSGVDDLIDPFTTFDKNDKFDTLLVKKKMAYDTISQVKAQILAIIGCLTRC